MNKKEVAERTVWTVLATPGGITGWYGADKLTDSIPLEDGLQEFLLEGVGFYLGLTVAAVFILGITSALLPKKPEN